MSFTAQRQKLLESDNQAANQTLKEFEKVGMDSFVYPDIEKYRDVALNFLYEDLIQMQTECDFRTILSNPAFNTSNNFAFDCLDISLYSSNIIIRRVPQWSKTALHCFDVLLIYYLSDILKEIVPQVTSKIKETDVYLFLISKGETYSIIGENFKSIYQYRSEFEHIQYTDQDGRRQIRTFSSKQLKKRKELILQFFKNALIPLLACYKLDIPNVSIK